MQAFRRGLFFAALASVALFSTATAQRQSQTFAQGHSMLLGPHAGFGTDDVDFFIGAQFAVPVANRFDIYPTFDFYFPGNDVTIWSLDGAVRYWPKLNMRNAGLYAGAGLNLTHASFNPPGPGSISDTNAGLSLFSGWDFKTTSIRPFAQARLVISDGSRFEFSGGINFKMN